MECEKRRRVRGEDARVADVRDAASGRAAAWRWAKLKRVAAVTA